MGKALFFLGGTHTKSQGLHAELVQKACPVMQVTFNPIHWQEPEYGFLRQWVDATKQQLQTAPQESSNTLVAISLGAWVALAALTELGATAHHYVQNVLMISPVVNITEKIEAACKPRWKRLVWRAVPKKSVPVPITAGKPPFPVTYYHIKTSRPFLVGKNLPVQNISPHITLRILASSQDLPSAQLIHNVWPGQNKKAPLLLPGDHHDISHHNLSLIRQELLELAR